MSQRDSQPVPGGAISELVSFVLWFLPTLVLALALARLVVWVERAGFAPALLPILVGAAVGGAAAGLSMLAGHSARTALAIGAAVAALACVAAEHAFFYLDYRAEFGRFAAGQSKLEIIQAAGGGVEPAGFAEFMQAGASRNFGPLPMWTWWLIHATLTIVAAVGVTLFVPRVGGGLAARSRAEN